MATLNKHENIHFTDIKVNGFVAYKNKNFEIDEFKPGDAHEFVVFVAPTEEGKNDKDLILCAFFQKCDIFDDLDIKCDKDNKSNKKFNKIMYELLKYNGVYGINDDSVINNVLTTLIKKVFDTLKSESNGKKIDDIKLKTLFTGGRRIKFSPRKVKAKAKASKQTRSPCQPISHKAKST